MKVLAIVEKLGDIFLNCFSGLIKIDMLKVQLQDCHNALLNQLGIIFLLRREVAHVTDAGGEEGLFQFLISEKKESARLLDVDNTFEVLEMGVAGHDFAVLL
jgi:hypothetical protein